MTELQKADAKLAKLEEELKQAKERKKAALAKEAEKKRKEDTRKKIILAGVIMARIKNGHLRWGAFKKMLNEDLASDRDRELFGLEPLPKEDSPAAPVPPEQLVGSSESIGWPDQQNPSEQYQ